MADITTATKHRYPFRIVDLDDETQKQIAAHSLGNPSGLKSFNHWGFKLAATTSLEEIERAYNHPLDPRDVWVVTPPKCGTTWTQEMVWLIANNLDYEGTSRPLLGPNGRWSFIDFPCLIDKEFVRWHDNDEGPNVIKFVSESMVGDVNRDSPRFVKSHLPMSMNNPDLLDVCKVIYVARNPKDACVSFYHHCRLIKVHDYVEDMETFMEDFMDGNLVETPFVEHMIEAWNLRHHPNMCMLFFEDMKRDMPSQIRKVAKFLGKSFEDAQVEKLAEFLKFDNMKKINEGRGKQQKDAEMDILKNKGAGSEAPNPMMHADRGSFFRKGKTGDWKNYFTPEMNNKFNRWLSHKLKGTDLRFVEELEHQT